MYGLDLLGLLYDKAVIAKVKADKRRDGFNPSVILWQILVREIV